MRLEETLVILAATTIVGILVALQPNVKIFLSVASASVAIAYIDLICVNVLRVTRTPRLVPKILSRTFNDLEDANSLLDTRF